MSSIVAKIQKFLFNPRARFTFLTEIGAYDWMSDEKYLKKRYKYFMGKDLDLENPQTYNEKLQ